MNSRPDLHALIESKLRECGGKKSDRFIAALCKCSPPTVAKVRRKMGAEFDPVSRMGRDGRTRSDQCKKEADFSAAADRFGGACRRLFYRIEKGQSTVTFDEFKHYARPASYGLKIIMDLLKGKSAG
ncbi:MAG TPA: hypothetical protein VI454_16235 [Verrucomicrobiae bacterium]|jgi:hypothetical protein